MGHHVDGGSVSVFGEITAHVGDSSHNILPGARTQELLAAITVESNASVRRGRLIERIWPEISSQNGRKALNTELWRLRKAIKHAGGAPEDWIKSTADSLMLRTDRGVDVDLLKFRREVSQGNDEPQHLVSVANLYKGEFAEGLTSNWVLEERLVIRQSFLRLLHKVINSLRQVNRLADALVFAERLCREEPFDEDAHRSLLLVQIQRGDRSAAVRHYQEFEHYLQDELGVSPSPKTQALYRICRDGGVLEDVAGVVEGPDEKTPDRVYAIEEPPKVDKARGAIQRSRRRVLEIERKTHTLLVMIRELEAELRSIDL